MSGATSKLPRRLLLSAGGAALLSVFDPGHGGVTDRDAGDGGDGRPRPGMPVVLGEARGVPGAGNAVPAPFGAAGPQYYVHAGPGMVALTFDDGPDPRYTPQILAILRRYDVTATFCMIGQSVQANREIARQVADSGHQLANHTWSHPDLGRSTPAAVRQEMERANDAIARVTGGTAPTLFRAPGGNFPPSAMTACSALGMRPLSWSVDPRDWTRPGTAFIVDNVLRHTATGSIILDHDGGGDRSQTVAALRLYLPRLIDAGYRFTTPDPQPGTG